MPYVSFTYEDGTLVYKSACRMCHGGCGALVYVKDGTVTKVRPDPDSPISRGRMCPKGLASVEYLYNPDRLKYPLKRIGERGEGKWQRISWDEALDTIAERVGGIQEEYGRESVVIAQGTGRHHLHHVVRFTNVIGTPNWMEPGTAQCFFPRVKTGEITYGCLPTCDYYNEKVNPELIVVWGHNPLVCNNDGESQFRLRDAIHKGSRLLVIDPRRTELAGKAELWLQIRPGSDDALALAMIHVIIAEDLYDHDFVENWTVGFDALAERVVGCTPEWAQAITWIPADKISQAARLFATVKPACLEWGVALEQTPNCFQTVRAVSLLPGLTGNFDVPGGFIEGMHIMPDPDTLPNALPMESQLKRLGIDRFPILCGTGPGMPASHIPTVLNALKTGKPYPVKALMLFGNNGLVGFGNSRDVYESFMKADFISCMDLYMTPTAELADIVLPAATWLEYDQLFSVPSLADHVILMTQKITQYAECRPDEDVLMEIARRLKCDYRAGSVEDIFNVQLAATAKAFPLFAGLDFQELKRRGSVSVPIEYRKYEKRGFRTPSGKMELYSSVLEKAGYDPLPHYEEPPESPYSTPEVAAEYPLVLITGGRIPGFFLSEGRQIPSLRRLNPDPLVEIHPDTAARYGIRDGDWVWIESRRGRIQQRAKVTDGIDPRVISCQHGWWFPEDKAPDHGCWRSNVNVLTDNQEPYDPIAGTYQLRALLCRIEKAEG